jgi:hypothetical protein
MRDTNTDINHTAIIAECVLRGRAKKHTKES